MKLKRRKHVERGKDGRLVSKGAVTLAERAADFWAQVEKSDGCWIWTGKKNPRHDYGQFYVGWDGKRYVELRAHRAAWSLATGQPLPDSAHVLHHCDTPLCVRPEHLWLGTKADNMKDAAQKGRMWWQKAKVRDEALRVLFTREDVEILRAIGISQVVGGRNTDINRTIRDRANGLADRIESLLPPLGLHESTR
jgi:hypothetical protein